MERNQKTIISALFTLVILLFATASFAQSVVNETVNSSINSDAATFKLTKVVEGLEHPWAINFLPEGKMIVTEKPGRMLLISDDEIFPLSEVPEMEFDGKDIIQDGQGGLMDVVPHPDYTVNGWIYFTFTSPGDDDSNFGDEDFATGTALARAKINEDDKTLEEVEVLYTQVPRTEPGRHYGSRIVFPGDGNVIFSIGDRGIRYPSQDLTDPAGSMIRLKEDGGIPDDNPFIGKEPGNLRPEIYSFGHRNNQGIAIDPNDGTIWTTEHGPFGGDLVFTVEKGKNYGWPQVTQGVEYDTKTKIGLGKEAPGVEKPKLVWDESMAPSGLAFYHDGNIAAWNGNLFAGSLFKEQLHRLVIENGEIVEDEVLLEKEIGRIRDVRMGPDGNLYIVTDHEDGALYKLEAI